MKKLVFSLMILLFLFNCELFDSPVSTIVLSSTDEVIFNNTIDLEYSITYEDGTKSTIAKTFTATSPGENIFSVRADRVDSNEVTITFGEYRLLGRWSSSEHTNTYTFSYNKDSDGNFIGKINGDSMAWTLEEHVITIYNSDYISGYVLVFFYSNDLLQLNGASYSSINIS